jgi:hypothetical protein
VGESCRIDALQTIVQEKEASIVEIQQDDAAVRAELE